MGHFVIDLASKIVDDFIFFVVWSFKVINLSLKVTEYPFDMLIWVIQKLFSQGNNDPLLAAGVRPWSRWRVFLSALWAFALGLWLLVLVLQTVHYYSYNSKIKKYNP